MGGLSGSDWYNMMLEKYKTEDGIKAEMARRSAKNKRLSKTTGLFHKLAKEDPERLKEIGRMHGRKKQT